MTVATKRQARKSTPKAAKVAPERKPKSRAVLGDHELTGLFAEAYEAYDMQMERVRFDTAGRRWWFVPESRQGQSVLLLQLKAVYGDAPPREDTISTHLLASDLGREMVEDVVRRLDEAPAQPDAA